MRVSHEPVYVYRRRRLGAALAVAVLGTLAGFGSAEVADRMLGGDGDESSAAALASSPSASVAAAQAEPTASESPTASPSASPSATAASPSPEPSPAEEADPGFDLAALSVDDPASTWVVVNKLRPLDPEGFAPEDLASVDGVGGGARMRADAAAAMTALHAAAEEADAGFSITTGYRDHAFQSSLYEGYVASRGRSAADRFSARPGYSEHQTGLAADIRSEGCDLEACFASTAAGVFVAEHGWEFGFIVRYPAGAEDVTGYIYEPWHLRYVGVELAAYLHEEGVATLEEAFGLDPAPDYG
ncbi:M15 family metallopeptidase [Demequina mangrovi]|uniref:D-Ala-D-Ala carboxypeptidase. Metallo peptidase. MEROPS family M15B n=1 Tax=Demequina mangrovi TaxID=1043493 RepID=A0A1H6YCK8_9MICO|nr:M15 family metallopeptidase [Demequina mangrovi]SEJ36767.1 D-Ala-D-Ala carboxypeptidase. Metallo peptidase. MEROPS family M15B [Demequina mangrovi]